MGRLQHQEPRFRPRQRRRPHARRVFHLRLGDGADADRDRLHAGLGRLSRANARHVSAAKTEAGQPRLAQTRIEQTRTRTRTMKPADIGIAILVAVIWGLAFVASRIALDEFSPELMTTLRFAIAAIPCLFVRKPDVSWPLLIAISFSLFLGQFLAQAF